VDEVHEERRLAERSHPTRRTTSPARVLGVGRGETGHPVVGHDCVRQRLSALAQSVEQEQRATREQRGWEQFARGTTCGASRGQQKSSEAIRNPQRPSEVIRGHQRSSEAIRVPQRPSEVTCGVGRAKASAILKEMHCHSMLLYGAHAHGHVGVPEGNL
jgi:hypothetical protein